MASFGNLSSVGIKEELDKTVWPPWTMFVLGWNMFVRSKSGGLGPWKMLISKAERVSDRLTGQNTVLATMLNRAEIMSIPTSVNSHIFVKHRPNNL
ncbi:hypothetical protein TB1_017935 [Malus domestica]